MKHATVSALPTNMIRLPELWSQFNINFQLHYLEQQWAKTLKH